MHLTWSLEQEINYLMLIHVLSNNYCLTRSVVVLHVGLHKLHILNWISRDLARDEDVDRFAPFFVHFSQLLAILGHYSPNPPSDQRYPGSKEWWLKYDTVSQFDVIALFYCYLVTTAVKALIPLLQGQLLADIYGDFAGFYRKITSESQLRWVRVVFIVLKLYHISHTLQMPRKQARK